MFSHIMVGANDVPTSKKFYDAVLGALGHRPGTEDDRGRVFYFTPTGVFAITKPIDGGAATAANGSTIGFAADSPEKAKAWHEAQLTMKNQKLTARKCESSIEADSGK